MKLFLASSFAVAASLLPGFVNEGLKGKTVTFIPTASIHEEVNYYVDDDRNAFKQLGIIVDELEVSTATTEEIAKKLRTNDYIFVSGGNAFFLLQELKRSGADKIIIEEINKGKLYIGESAGSVIVSKNIEYIRHMDNPDVAPGLNNDFSALSVVDFYPLPHQGSEYFEESVEKILFEYKSVLELKPFSNSQAILILEDKIEIRE
jgi:dipeptidase E